MIEAVGDVWEYPADVLCVPTNGTVKRNGEAVMGRGVALQAKLRFPALPLQLGRALATGGNIVHVVTPGLRPRIVSFPVKHHWAQAADLDLIRQSARQLRELAIGWFSGKVIVLPRPGCGNGGRTWEEVRPLLVDLPDNVHVIDYVPLACAGEFQELEDDEPTRAERRESRRANNRKMKVDGVSVKVLHRLANERTLSRE